MHQTFFALNVEAFHNDRVQFPLIHLAESKEVDYIAQGIPLEYLTRHVVFLVILYKNSQHPPFLPCALLVITSF